MLAGELGGAKRDSKKFEQELIQRSYCGIHNPQCVVKVSNALLAVISAKELPVSSLQQVVLQFSGQHLGVAHRQSSGQGEAQRGYSSQGERSRRDDTGM